jgi:hypothetical protein
MGGEMYKSGMMTFAESVMGEYNLPEKFKPGLLRHLGDSYDIGHEVATEACRRYDFLTGILKPEEVGLAAGLHDIGRSMQSNQLFHELRGARFLEDHGVERGVVETELDAYRLAQMIRPHGFVYEQWVDSENEGAAREFEGIDDLLLIPRTWPEMIVAYSDLTNVNGERMGMRDRLEDVKLKYAGENRGKAAREAEWRLLILNERVEALRNGDLDNREVMIYGFI